MINALCCFICSGVSFALGIFTGIVIVISTKDDKESFGEKENDVPGSF